MHGTRVQARAMRVQWAHFASKAPSCRLLALWAPTQPAQQSTHARSASQASISPPSDRQAVCSATPALLASAKHAAARLRATAQTAFLASTSTRMRPSASAVLRASTSRLPRTCSHASSAWRAFISREAVCLTVLRVRQGRSRTLGLKLVQLNAPNVQPGVSPKFQH